MLQASQQAGHSGLHVMDRVFDILAALEKEPELNVTEVARRLGVDKSTASRQLSALARRDYVERDPLTGRFRLGLRFLRLGSLVAERLNLRSIALPIMTRLRDTTGETVCLSIRRGAERVYIDVEESRHQVRRTQQIGLFSPLYPGAPGKVFLAFMDPAEATAIIATQGDVRFTMGAAPDPRAVEAELGSIRASGVAWSQEETVPGSGAAAFPVFDHSGEVAAVLSIAMPLPRCTPELRANCVEQGRAAAGELSRNLGHARRRSGDPLLNLS